MNLSKPEEYLNLDNYDLAVIIALGSNLSVLPSAPSDILCAALDQFQKSGLSVVRRSSFWGSAAWPDPAEPDYINAVALVETTLEPEAVLETLHALEARFERVRGRPNAPRTLDLDLIAYGRQVRAQSLILPHPRAAERLFVMGPLAEIAPGWTHPLNGRTATVLAASASVGCDARPLPD
jgi:2-amino-4-hydroxy-6-hydroxymethyldihydropteridine diphosphokinase